jgi:outer membrane protein OmpA-like peptidoglycan-associated protein
MRSFEQPKGPESDKSQTPDAHPHLTPDARLQLAKRMGNRRFTQYVLQRDDAADTKETMRDKLLKTHYYGGTDNFDTEWIPPPKGGTVGTYKVKLKVKYVWKYKGFKGKIKKKDQWTDTERDNFHDGMVKAGKEWQGKFALTCNDPDAKNIQAKVVVDIVRMDDSASGSPHQTITVYKTPPKADRLRSSVTGDTSELDWRDPMPDKKEKYTDVEDRPVYMWQVLPFDNNRADINPAIQGLLDGDVLPGLEAWRPWLYLARLIDKDLLKLSVRIIGRTSISGRKKYNKTLGQKRMKAVGKYMSSKSPWLKEHDAVGGTAGESGMENDEKSRRVDIHAWINRKDPGSVTQNTAAHELGHMFGLGDEYEDTDEKRVMGDKPSHYEDVSKEIDTAAAEQTRVMDSENIMSTGSKILPAHYVPFVDGLESLTKTGWTIQG